MATGTRDDTMPQAVSHVFAVGAHTVPTHYRLGIVLQQSLIEIALPPRAGCLALVERLRFQPFSTSAPVPCQGLAPGSLSTAAWLSSRWAVMPALRHRPPEFVIAVNPHVVRGRHLHNV